jgi:hypothetical protein
MCRCQEEIDFINQFVNLKGDEKVITFIADILFHNGNDIEKSNVISNLFSNGYCYYFAKILQDAFPGGEICICYPYGHIVYIYNNIAYDIDGISSAEYEMYIPISRLGEAINDFRHIEGKSYNISKEEIEKIKEDWIARSV